MFGISENKVITDENKIEEIINRGIENIFPSKDFLKNKLLKGEKVSLYLGIDPTGPNLHLGHVIPLLRLRELQKLGHQVILLMGDFTGMVGDPTNKTATRKKLTHNEVMANQKEYKKQASKFISFDGYNKALFKYNSEWLSKLNFGDVLELASLVTVDQMMKRDMFEKRNQEGKPIYIHEFMYPLMQGYDSVAMDVDGEIGGNDQTFNMLIGRDLIKAYRNKEKFVIATKLLVDAEGKKMGKTEGNMVSLDQTPEDIFGRVMSWNDDLIVQGLEIATLMPWEEVKHITKELKNGTNPKEYKMILASEIVKMCHDQNAAQAARVAFENTFGKKEFPDDAKVLEVSPKDKIADCLVENQIVESKSELRRLIAAGAASDFPSQKITDPNEIVGEKERKIKIGKKTFIILKPK